MSTYIKPSKNELMDLEIIIQKDFGILLQVISTLL
jgi:phage-related protein